MKAVTYAGKTFGRFLLSSSRAGSPLNLTDRKCVKKYIYIACSRVPYNKLVTNLACSSRTGEYWPSVVFVRTSRCSVRSVTTSGQYSPVRSSRSVSKRLIFSNFENYVRCEKDLKDNKDNSLHLAQKYARIFILVH